MRAVLSSLVRNNLKRKKKKSVFIQFLSLTFTSFMYKIKENEYWRREGNDLKSCSSSFSHTNLLWPPSNNLYFHPSPIAVTFSTFVCIEYYLNEMCLRNYTHKIMLFDIICLIKCRTCCSFLRNTPLKPFYICQHLYR